MESVRERERNERRRLRRALVIMSAVGSIGIGQLVSVILSLSAFFGNRTIRFLLPFCDL